MGEPLERSFYGRKGVTIMDDVLDRINEIPCQSFRIEDTLTYDFGIQTRNSDNTFRTMCEILDDASKIYWNLNDEITMLSH